MMMIQLSQQSNSLCCRVLDHADILNNILGKKKKVIVIKYTTLPIKLNFDKHEVLLNVTRESQLLCSTSI